MCFAHSLGELHGNSSRPAQLAHGTPLTLRALLQTCPPGIRCPGGVSDPLRRNPGVDERYLWRHNDSRHK